MERLLDTGPLLVTLKDSNDKSIIFSHAKKLKDKKNSSGKPYRIDDQRTNKEQGRFQKQRNMLWHNKNIKTTAHRIELSVKKGQLYIDNKQFESRIRKPSAEKLVRLKTDEIKELKSLQIKQGNTIMEQGSKFTGFVADASTFEDVNAAYEWVRYHNMSARHIICTCILPGSQVVEQQDYEDDDEHSAGWKLLQYLLSIKAKSRAVFVAQDYQGQYIGPICFDCIIKAAKSAINQKPYNAKEGEFQFSWKATKLTRGGFAGHPLKHVDQVSDSEFESCGDTSEVESEIEFKQGTNWEDAVNLTEAKLVQPLAVSQPQLKGENGTELSSKCT